MYGDILNPTTEVQFNLNPKQHLSHFGADMTASDKGKQLVFAFKEGRHTKEYSYPDNYQDLKEAQIEALKEGVKERQALFQKYFPIECVDLLKETQHWDKPYTFARPPGHTVITGQPSKSYKKKRKKTCHCYQQLLQKKTRHVIKIKLKTPKMRTWMQMTWKKEEENGRLANV